MLTPTPSIDRMPGLLAIYADRLKPQDKNPLTFMKARFGIVDEPLVKAIDKKDTQTIPMFGGDDHSRAKAGGEVGINGYHYKGGQFLPSTQAEPGKWKIGKKWVHSGKELIAPGQFGHQPTPFSRALFALAGPGYMTVLGDDGKLSVNQGVRDYSGQAITGGTEIQPGVKGVLGKESLTLDEIVGAWNSGQRWFDVKPEGVTVIENHETGDFGPIFRQFRHDSKGAIAHLKNAKTGEAIAALYHPEVGDIDLVWGHTSDNPRAKGMGIAKLAKWHPEVLGDLQGFISRLNVTQKHQNKLFLRDPMGSRAAIQLEWGGKTKTWLLTAYEKDGAGTSTTDDTTGVGSEDDRARLNSSHDATIAQSPDKDKAQPPLGAKAKRALEHLKAGGFFRKQLHTQYRGGEKFETHLHDEHGGTVYGIGFKTFHELKTAGHLESVVGIPSSSVWRSEWKIRADAVQEIPAVLPQAVTFYEDIPNESWLKEKIDYARSKPRNSFGVPRMDAVTGHFKGRVMIPTRWAKDFNGERGEQSNVRQKNLDGIREVLRETGKMPIENGEEYLPYIEVGYDGVPWVSEGNHRIMAAAAEGWDYIPADVRYFDGGQRNARKMGPENLLEITERVLADRQTLTKAQPRILFFKGGTPGTPGLYQKLITDKHGKKVIHWVKPSGGHAATHNEDQAELFNIDGTPYQSLETRPDTTDKQRHVGMDALAALKRRVNLLRASGGSAATLLGARLYASFIASGHNQLTGQKITSPEDLAALAQVYRDPRFETFRCVFLKDDEVVGESAYTSRLPGTVHLPDDYTRQVKSDKQRFGADGYYILHNHPSGSARPSKADERLTEELNRAVSGMKAHVVIDHSEYGLITKEGRVSVVQKPDLEGPDYHSSPSLDHPMLGVTLGGPADVAMAAKALAAELKGGGAVLVMTKGFECRVDLIASVPSALMDTMSATSGKRTRAKAWLRGVGRATGAGAHHFLIVSDADYFSKKEALKKMVGAGLFTDVVSHGGQSLCTDDYVPHYGRKLFEDLRPGHKVAEHQTLASDLEAQEKYLTDGAKKLGYADIDDLAMNDYPAFEQLAVQWRMDHPVETALYQPQATYGALFKAPEVRNAAGKLLAPNGQPSKLTDGQWHQVRSPEFMRWFGAWKSKPTDQVQVVKASILEIDHTDTEAVRRWLTSSPEFKQPVLNEDSGIDVNFSNGNLKDSLKRRGEEQRSGYTVLREMIGSAKFVGFETANRANIKGQDIYFSAMELNGKLYSVRIKADVRHDKSTAYKDHRVNEIDYVSDIEVLPAVNKGGAVGALGYPGDTGPTRSGSTVSLASLMQSDKFESSKVVDANGEPKVLYHGTTADIDRYDPKTDQRLPGFWMAPTPSLAGTYAAGGVVNPSRYPTGANIVPVFVKADKLRVFDGRKESMLHVWDDYQNGDFNGFEELGFDGDVYAYSVKKASATSVL